MGLCRNFKLWLIVFLLAVPFNLELNDTQASQSTGNINKDIGVERVTLTNDGKVFAWDKHGYVISGWPISPPEKDAGFILAPILFDTDFDGESEILTVSRIVNGKAVFHVYKGNGVENTTWQFDIGEDGSEITEIPRIADLNGDSIFEIIYPLKNGSIKVLNRNFTPNQLLKNANVSDRPFVTIDDFDNDGVENVVANTRNSVFVWSKNGDRIDLQGIGGGEEILQKIRLFDITGDDIDEIIFSTANRLKFASQAGIVFLDIPYFAFSSVSQPTIADMNLDGVAEILIITNFGKVLAFTLKGEMLTDWEVDLTVGDSLLPSIGILADDRYIGYFSTATGYDQNTIYKSKYGYSFLKFGEYSHQFDSAVDLAWADFLKISNYYVHPKVFTPNGDGVNDNASFHYTTDKPSTVSLFVLNSNGQILAKPVDDAERPAGENKEVWNGAINSGQVDSGTYVLRLVAKSEAGIITSADSTAIVNGIESEIESPSDTNPNDENFPNVFGTVIIRGTSMDPNLAEGEETGDFRAYKLYYKNGVWHPKEDEILTAGNENSSWKPIPVPITNQSPVNPGKEPADGTFPNSNISSRPIQHGVLGFFDTTDPVKTPNGKYTILLKAMDSNGNVAGKISYDSVVVSAGNIPQDNPHDPNNPYDPANPNNPIYNGPKIAPANPNDPSVGTINVTNTLIDHNNPSTTASFALANETANIRLSIYKLGSDGQLGGIVYTQLDTSRAAGEYSYTWSGTTTLGRPVTGGDYKIRVEVEAIDGTGYDSADSEAISVAMGFASSDFLTVESLQIANSTLNLLDSINSGSTHDPATITYSLSKPAFATLEIFDGIPEPEGTGKIKRTLLSDHFAKQDSVNWYGEEDSGQLLFDVEKAYLKLTVKSEDVGNSETIIYKYQTPFIDCAEEPTFYPAICLAKQKASNNLIAEIDSLKGDDNEELVNGEDPMEHPLTGNPDFLWRASGKGVVKVEFGVGMSGRGRNYYWRPQEFAQPWQAVYICQRGESCGGDKKGCNPYTPPPVPHTSKLIYNYNPQYKLKSFGIASKLSNTISFENLSFNTSFFDLLNPLILSGIYFEGPRKYTLNEENGHYYYDGKQFPRSLRNGVLEFDAWFNTDEAQDGGVDPQGYFAANCGDVTGDGEHDEKDLTEAKTQLENYAPFECLPGEWGNLVPCDEAGIYAEYEIKTMCLSPFVSDEANNAISTGDGNKPVSTYTKDSELAKCAGLSVIPNTLHSAIYRLTGAWANINGQKRNYYPTSKAQGSIVANAFRIWQGYSDSVALSGKNFYASVNPDYAVEFDSLKDGLISPYQSADKITFADRKIYGEVLDFNKDEFHLTSAPIKIYPAFLNNHLKQPVEDKAYTFSNIVHITKPWNIELLYPNGDPVTALEASEQNLYSDGTIPNDQGIPETNKNTMDTFVLHMKPDGVPKRFVSIYGSAQPGYELFYYNYDDKNPSWRCLSEYYDSAKDEIVCRPPINQKSGVINGLLAYWDVTRLNGETYTLVLKTSSGGETKQDTVNVAIGAPVTKGALQQIYTPFKRASLLFDPNSLETDSDLITISEVAPAEAEFKLPTGITPIGPIFDLKPDNIKLNPNAHVELHAVYTMKELYDVYHIGGKMGDKEALSQLTFYNLADNNELEPIATIVEFGCRHPDLDDPVWNGCSPVDADFVRFTALLDHFSEYGLINYSVSGFNIETPKPDSINRGVIGIKASVNLANGSLSPVKKFEISYAPASAPGSRTVIASLDVPTADFSWDTNGLNGEYIIYFSSVDTNDRTNENKFSLAIDNSAALSTLRINARPVSSGATIGVSGDSVFEIVSTDGELKGSSVDKVEFNFDGGEAKEYSGPFILFDYFVEGSHVMNFRSIDNAGNAEEWNSVTINISRKIESGSISGISLEFIGPYYNGDGQTWIGPATSLSLKAESANLHHIEHKLNDGIFEIYTEPVSLSGVADGLYWFTYYAVDDFGLAGNSTSKQLIFDGTPPITEISLEGKFAKNGNEYLINEDTKIQLSSQDRGEFPSGLQYIEYKIGNGAWKTYTQAISLVSAGKFFARGRDTVGNLEQSLELGFVFDREPPTAKLVSKIEEFSPNGDGVVDEAKISFSIADDFADKLFVDFIIKDSDGHEYQLKDGGEATAGEINLSWNGILDGKPAGEGGYGYQITIFDERNNPSISTAGTFVLDNTPPVLEQIGSKRFIVSPNGGENILSFDFTVTDKLLPNGIKAALNILSDGHSVKSLEKYVSTPPNFSTISWNGKNQAGNELIEGNYTFMLSATDLAGNTTNASPVNTDVSGSLIVDTKEPTTELLLLGSYYEGEDTIWFGSSGQIAFSATDPAPGVGVKETLSAFDEVDFQLFVKPIPPPIDSLEHVLKYYSVDYINNAEQVNSVRLRYDATPPISSLEITGPREDSDRYTFVSPKTLFAVESNDGGGVGVEKIYMHTSEYGDSEPAIYRSPFSFEKDKIEYGIHGFKYWAKDFLGNEENKKTFEIFFDQRAPKTELAVEGTHIKTIADNLDKYFVTKETSFAFNAISDRDDVEKTEYRLDGGDWIAGNSFPASTGEHRLEFRSVDRLGNEEPIATILFAVDSEPPVTDMLVNGTVSTGVVETSPDASITFSSMDSAAGPRKIWFRIDGGEWTEYVEKISLKDLSGGKHTLSIYGVDGLGNKEPEKNYQLNISDIDFFQEVSVVPRALIFMLQTIDFSDDTPRPNEELLNGILETMGGFYKIVYSYGDFAENLRSDRYNIFIFATDAALVKFDDRPEVERIFKELAARIHKGDSFISFLGATSVTGETWARFAGKITGGKNGLYGKGIATIAGHIGEDAILTSVPDAKTERFFVGEVADYQISLLNRSEHPVDVSLSYNWAIPAGESSNPIYDSFAEINRTASKNDEFQIDAEASKVVSTLFRLGDNLTFAHPEGTLAFEWDNGLTSNLRVPDVIEAEGDLQALIDSVMDKVEKEEKTFALLNKLKQELALVEKTPENIPTIDFQIDDLLSAIEDAENNADEEIQYDLEEIYEVVSAVYGPYFNQVVDTNVADDPLQNYNEDVTQSIGGGCSLITIPK